MTDEKDEFEKEKNFLEKYQDDASPCMSCGSVQCAFCHEKVVEILKAYKAQILAENPMNGLTDEELVFIKSEIPNSYTGIGVKNKIQTELSRREKEAKL